MDSICSPDMPRRTFIATMAGGLLAAPLAAEAQPVTNLARRWLPGLASELVRVNVDVIVAASTPLARAVQQATTTIPIVAPALGDPVGDGLVTSLAWPGGNLTG
jgi:hypothetical protein